MTLQKESFFLSEDTCRWQTCFTAVLQDAFSGYGFWTMAVIHNAQANSSTHTSRKRIAREHRMHLPAAGQNSQSFLNRPEGWSIVLGNPSLRSWTPLAAPPVPSCTVRAGMQLKSLLYLVQISAILSYVFRSIFLSQSQLSNSASLYFWLE